MAQIKGSKDSSQNKPTRLDTDNLCNFVVAFLYSKEAMSRKTFREIRRTQRRTDCYRRVVELCSNIDDLQTAKELLDSLRNQPTVLSVTKHAQQQEPLQPQRTKSVGPSRTPNQSTAVSSRSSNASTNPLASLTTGTFIRGIAFLEDKLYLLRDSTIDVYDTAKNTKFAALQVDNLLNATDMAACTAHKCLYIIDARDNFSERSINSKTKVIRFHVQPKLLRFEWLVGDAAEKLSVTPSTTVLVTCPLSRHLREFTCDGHLARTIQLHADLVNPLHAVQLPSGQLLVSQVVRDRGLFRVCLVANADDCSPSQTFNSPEHVKVPYHVGVDSFGAFVFVADMSGNRIAMLGSRQLNHKKDFIVTPITASASLHPSCFCLDQSLHRLFVALNDYSDHGCINYAAEFSWP